MGNIAIKLGTEVASFIRTGTTRSVNPLKLVQPNSMGRGLRFAPEFKCDVFRLDHNSSAYINNQLKNLYGIESSLTDSIAAQRTLSAVEDFVKINKKQKMFSGLRIGVDSYDASKLEHILPTNEEGVGHVIDELGYFAFNSSKNDCLLRFNKNFDWSKLEEVTKRMYDEGQIPSDNPLCLIYEKLGHYLNFKYNPHAYNISATRHYTNKSELLARRISGSDNMLDFNAKYIAGRMCGNRYPKEMFTYFEENVCNTNLRFPKPKEIPVKQGSQHKFKSIDDAKKYLLENYGIEGDFVSLEQANMFAGSVDDLSKVIGSNEYFKGLKVKVDAKKFDNLFTDASCHTNADTGEGIIYINPARNWKKRKQLSLADYEAGLHPSPNPKQTYVHELAHWLDFKGNPIKYSEDCYNFKNGTYFNAIGKNRTAKVSTYANASTGEFNAEYVCGRINGVQYPKCTEKEFLDGWNGPVMNFDAL